MTTQHALDVPLRSPDEVMRLSRLGSLHQCRLSFMRALLRRLKREGWVFERPVWRIDERGEGCAVYTAHGPRRSYSLVAFTRDLPDELRSDRVIATAWDATFCLYDGVPSEADIERLAANVPLQEAGRVSDSELSLSRANRSVRLWQHVVERLAAGEQPDRQQVEQVGYLMRTTAVYGSGKFGAADRYLIQDRTLAGGPFRIEMLSVYLTRAFSLDLVEHMAQVRGGEQAVAIDPALRRRFGVGNSTGLGMAPFLINHPALLHRWIAARETALATVCGLDRASDEVQQRFLQLLNRAVINAEQWHSQHELQIEKLKALKADLAQLQSHLADFDFSQSRPWEALRLWAKNTLSLEGQEQLVSLMLEPYGELIDHLTRSMGADEYEEFRIDGGQSVAALRQQLEQNYDWALNADYQSAAQARFWYVSEEKLEPRLGERFDEPGAELELPLATGRDARALYQALKPLASEMPLADFLLTHPEHRHMVRRVQLQARYPYAEIRDNLIDQHMLPIDLLRCKLSFFGATHFDPRSDRWVRISMFSNAPFPQELAAAPEDDWAYPPMENAQ